MCERFIESFKVNSQNSVRSETAVKFIVYTIHLHGVHNIVGYKFFDHPLKEGWSYVSLSLSDGRLVMLFRF